MEQLEIPMPPSQPRVKKREPRSFYSAVLLLRRAGYAVTRCGRKTHLVRGKRVPTKAIKELARAIERGIA
jgi:hypothetical protein